MEIFTTALRNKKYVVNLEIDNSLKWVHFNLVSGPIASDALWK